MPEKLYPVHFRHFQIQNDHIRTECFQFSQGESPVEGFTDHLQFRIGLDDFTYEISHER